jgi:hypothetical protein
MNKRIQQLAQEAGMYVDLNGNPWPKWMSAEECEVAYKKFAELIVRECAKICIEQNVSNLDLDVIRESGKFTLQDLATKSCGENLSNQIKEHFGVEE